jgi:hypothetical protein
MLYSAFCQNISGTGTIWISPVEADNLEDAILTAQADCATDWETDPDEVHVLGIAEGDINILHWQDIHPDA